MWGVEAEEAPVQQFAQPPANHFVTTIVWELGSLEKMSTPDTFIQFLAIMMHDAVRRSFDHVLLVHEYMSLDCIALLSSNALMGGSEGV